MLLAINVLNVIHRVKVVLMLVFIPALHAYLANCFSILIVWTIAPTGTILIVWDARHVSPIAQLALL